MSARRKLWMIIGVLSVCAVAAGFALFNPLDALFGTPSERRPGNNGAFHSAGSFKVQVAVDPARPRIGKNHLTVLLRDEGNKPVVGARVHALAEMPAMGAMPAMRATSDITETGPGRFEGDFELSMDGAWPLSLAIDSKALGQAQLSFDMSTSRPGLRLASATPRPMGPGSGSLSTTDEQALPGNAAPPGTIQVDLRRRQLIGVTLGKVERKKLKQSIRAVGQVLYDETRLTDITLKFDAWIGELYADYVGVQVSRGHPLFTVYSPQLVAAQEEYLETRRRRKRDDDSLLAASRRRLALWDIGRAQIRELEQRGRALEYVAIYAPISGSVVEKHVVAGTAVKAGTTLLRIADLSKVWVEAQVYEYELGLVKVGAAAEVVLTSLPSRRFDGRVAYLYPSLQADTRTARLRVELDNPEGLLHPQAYAQVHLAADLGERLVVPKSAVIYAGRSRVVFVDVGQGYLDPRKIATGIRSEEEIEVLDGLHEGEVVVTSGNFLIATESKLKAGIDQW